MSDDDLSLPVLLERLPVADHGPDFWSDLESRLADAPPSGLDRRRNARRRGLALSAAAAAVVAVIVGLRLFGADDDPPTITDTPSTTSAPADTEEDSAPPPDADGPAPADTLEWTGLGPGAGPDLADGQSANISWVGSRFAAFSFDADRPPIEVSLDGRTWAPLEGLPDELEPRSMVGWRDSLAVTARPPAEPGGSTLASVALSLDRGVSWQILPGAGPAEPSSPHLTYRTEPGGVAVIGDTVLLSTIVNSQVDLSSALEDAGFPLLGSASADLTWNDAEWWVDVCQPITPGAECTEERRHRLADLGIDPGEMPVGRGENWSPQSSAFYRSTGGGPFEEIDLGLGIGDLMQVHVVADHFVITTTSLTFDEGEPTRGPSEVWRSSDGVTWTSSPLDIDPITTPLFGAVERIVPGDDALYALRDGEPIRSLDVGRTWEVLPVAGDVEIHGIVAGPAGVLLLGRTEPVPFVAPDEIVKNGYALTLENGITIRDPSGAVIVSPGDPTFEPPAGAPVLVEIEEGPVFYELRDPVSGDVLLEILDTDARDLSGLRSGEDCFSGPAQFVAWSPDGTSFEWMPAGEAFGGDGSVETTPESIAIGLETAIAWVNRPVAATAADFRATTEFADDTTPVEGQATICMGSEGAHEAFVAELR